MEQQTVKRWNLTVVLHRGRQVLCEIESTDAPANGEYVSAEDYATLERRVRELEGKALAYDNIAERGQECWDYCQQHADGRFGRNIWHIVLEDALRFRSLPAPPSQEGR